jgi:hypothetical protein
MALSRLQQDILARIAKNRSETSYIAGGVALNRNWTRLSDDIDVFHDTDEEIGVNADQDIATLMADGFRVFIVVNVYGCVEAEVSRDGSSTLIQWMSETRTRFFPLVRDADWGSRLHPADLAVNKVLAASSRTKARDYVDLVVIDENYCPLGAIVMAASGKPPHYSPVRMIDEIRRRGLSVASEEFESVKTLQKGYSAAVIREKLVAGLDRAEAYVRQSPAETVGLLAVDAAGTPVQVLALDEAGVTFRKATPEPDVMPGFAETSSI